MSLFTEIVIHISVRKELSARDFFVPTVLTGMLACMLSHPSLLNAKNEGPDLSRRPPFSVWALQLAVFPSVPVTS